MLALLSDMLQLSCHRKMCCTVCTSQEICAGVNVVPCKTCELVINWERGQNCSYIKWSPFAPKWTASIIFYSSMLLPCLSSCHIILSPRSRKIKNKNICKHAALPAQQTQILQLVSDKNRAQSRSMFPHDFSTPTSGLVHAPCAMIVLLQQQFCHQMLVLEKKNKSQALVMHRSHSQTCCNKT